MWPQLWPCVRACECVYVLGDSSIVVSQVFSNRFVTLSALLFGRFRLSVSWMNTFRMISSSRWRRDCLTLPLRNRISTCRPNRVQSTVPNRPSTAASRHHLRLPAAGWSRVLAIPVSPPKTIWEYPVWAVQAVWWIPSVRRPSSIRIQPMPSIRYSFYSFVTS